METDLVLQEFIVQCFHCKGKKGRTIKPKGKIWVFCPNCGAGLDIMNKVTICASCGHRTEDKEIVVSYKVKYGLNVGRVINAPVCSEKCKEKFLVKMREWDTISKLAGR